MSKDKKKEKTEPGTITVFGNGTARATPDLMRVIISIESRASKVALAYGQAGERVSAVSASLRADGVPATDIATSGLAVRTETVWTEGEGSRITGYTATTDLTVVLRNLEVATSPAAAESNPSDAAAGSDGKDSDTTAAERDSATASKSGASITEATPGPATIIANAVEAGGDDVRLGGLTLTFADQEGLLRQARDTAWDNALAKAEQYAARTPRALGTVLEITENASAASPIRFAARAMSAPASDGFAGSAVPVELGEGEVSAAIRVTWALD